MHLNIEQIQRYGIVCVDVLVGVEKSPLQHKMIVIQNSLRNERFGLVHPVDCQGEKEKKTNNVMLLL